MAFAWPRVASRRKPTKSFALAADPAPCLTESCVLYNAYTAMALAAAAAAGTWNGSAAYGAMPNKSSRQLSGGGFRKFSFRAQALWKAPQKALCSTLSSALQPKMQRPLPCVRRLVSTR